MRGIIFDLDDTLYPRERFVLSGLAAVARFANREWHIEVDRAYVTLRRAFAFGARGFEFQALCAAFRLDATAVPRLVQAFREHVPDLWLPDRTRSTLVQLRQEGWALVVLTNGLPDVQARKVSALGLEPLVDHVVYAEEHAEGGKPALAAFSKALGLLAVPPSQAVCVGDDVRCDVEGARAAGLRTIRLARPGITVPPAREADVVAVSIDAVPALAASLLERAVAHVA